MAKTKTKTATANKKLATKQLATITGKAMNDGVDVVSNELIAKMAADPTHKPALYRIVGEVKSYKDGNGQYGRYVKFRGTFEGRMLDNPTQPFASKWCCIPQTGTEIIEDQLDEAHLQAKQAGDDGTGIRFQFAFEIGAEYRLKAGRDSYKYWVNTLIDIPEEANPLAALTAEIFGDLLAIEE